MATRYVGADTVFAYTPIIPPRAAIEAAVETLVAVLDAMDGDPDIELNGDELDGTGGEDDFIEFSLSHVELGAGCPVSDPGGCEHDGREPDYVAGFPIGRRQ